VQRQILRSGQLEQRNHGSGIGGILRVLCVSISISVRSFTIQVVQVTIHDELLPVVPYRRNNTPAQPVLARTHARTVYEGRRLLEDVSRAFDMQRDLRP
jgi:hypothetical protein